MKKVDLNRGWPGGCCWAPVMLSEGEWVGNCCWGCRELSLVMGRGVGTLVTAPQESHQESFAYHLLDTCPSNTNG